MLPYEEMRHNKNFLQKNVIFKKNVQKTLWHYIEIIYK